MRLGGRFNAAKLRLVTADAGGAIFYFFSTKT